METHDCGSRLTADGFALAQMIGPAMSDLDSLKRRFLEARGRSAPRLTVATPPRTLIEELPEVLAVFARIYPQAEICLLGVDLDQPRLVAEPCHALSLASAPKELLRRDTRMARSF